MNIDVLKMLGKLSVLFLFEALLTLMLDFHPIFLHYLKEYVRLGAGIVAFSTLLNGIAFTRFTSDTVVNPRDHANLRV